MTDFTAWTIDGLRKQYRDLSAEYDRITMGRSPGNYARMQECQGDMDRITTELMRREKAE